MREPFDWTMSATGGAPPANFRNRFAKEGLHAAYDVMGVRGILGLSQERFARALGISVHTLRNWEQGTRVPEGPAIALLRIAARRPDVFLANLT